MPTKPEIIFFQIWFQKAHLMPIFTNVATISCLFCMIFLDSNLQLYFPAHLPAHFDQKAYKNAEAADQRNEYGEAAKGSSGGN